MNQKINFLLIRGLGREAGHWYDFPEKLEAAIPNSKSYKLNLPGIDYDKPTPITISKMTNIMRDKWLSLPNEGARWFVISISLGGMITLDWAARFPLDFSGIITINSSSRRTKNIFKRISPAALKMVGKALIQKSVRERERAAIEFTTNTTSISTELLDHWEKVAVEKPLKYRVFIKQLMAASYFKPPKELSTPYLALASRADTFVHYSCSQDLARWYNASIKLHNTAGHDLPLDDSKWVIENVKSFI